MKASWIFFLLTFLLVNCTNQRADEGFTTKGSEPEMSVEADQASPPSPPPPAMKIHQTTSAQ
ncbi:MAG: hypothetical protein IPN33_18730 [Saprospiraceae bacterium]|nr:hypothetical protein [Saprospiraceae bacterium]